MLKPRHLSPTRSVWLMFFVRFIRCWGSTQPKNTPIRSEDLFPSLMGGRSFPA